MSPEAQRIAIAEACGWILEPAGKDSFGVYYAAFWRHSDKQGVHVLPDYLADLNAMHEAEKVGQSLVKGFWTAYTAALKIAGATQIVHATAPQRAEAFLRTLNLWQDTPEKVEP